MPGRIELPVKRPTDPLTHPVPSVEQKPQALTHESSFVGARPSSAAPVLTEPPRPDIYISAPTKGLLCLWDGGSVRRGRPRTAALRQKSFRVLGLGASVRRGGGTDGSVKVSRALRSLF